MATLMHIVATQWDGAAPRLLARAGDQAARLVPVGDFAWRVGRRTCTGHWQDGWRPCPEDASVGPAGQCLACFRGRGDPQRITDMPECVFEPRCRGQPEACVCSFGGARGSVPHVVYMAFYGGLPKIGMTTAARVRTRLTEQGADAWFVVQACPDRQSARATETQIAVLYGVPEFRRHQEILMQATRPVDRQRIEAKAAQWMDDLGVRYDVDRRLHHVEHPLRPLPARPHRVPAPGEHAGTWLGAKGAYWFYRPLPDLERRLDVGAPVLAIKRQDLVGRWVEVSEPRTTLTA